MRRRRLLPLTVALCAVAGLSAFGWACAQTQSAAEISINIAERHQTMRGWEVTSRFWYENKSEDRFDGTWLAYSEPVAEVLANDIGVNRVRIELRSGAENSVDHYARFRDGALTYRGYRAVRYEKINDNDDPQVANPAGFQFSDLDSQVESVVLPMRRQLRARGETLIVNLCYVDFNNGETQGSLSHARNPDEYAELIHETFRHLQDKYGFAPDSFELVLEPENTLSWRGRTLGHALPVLAARLAASGFHPTFIAPSTTRADAATSYYRDMMSVRAARASTPMLSYHAYDMPNDGIRRDIAAMAHRYGVETAMLEHLQGDAGELHRDLTQGGVSAWQQYGVAHLEPGPGEDSGYLMFVDRAYQGRDAVRLGSRTWALAAYFRNVRAGAVRIGAESRSPELRVTAFENPSGLVSVIAITERAQSIAFHGLPPGEYAAEMYANDVLAREIAVETVQAGRSATVAAPQGGVLVMRQLQ